METPITRTILFFRHRYLVWLAKRTTKRIDRLTAMRLREHENVDAIFHAELSRAASTLESVRTRLASIGSHDARYRNRR